ncbi:MAG: asparagine synthase (glutamine-hydrolyzing) [Desulfobacteraceae bacterium]|nr:MAG: asparagine synthase (glutamine-hydrolyzing) [Desulfobacteraceae bacterium]
MIGRSIAGDSWTETLNRMALALSHRGPDDGGIWFDPEAGAGLAHRRLSIIDLSEEGHQPMISHSGRYVIAFNGEVYNFKELRKELHQEPIAWRGNSDTEVMLAAFDHWGIRRAVKQFIGMFAFAVWDRQDHLLYLCRDRLGIKPLYFSRISKGLLFGSELKAIMKHPDFVPEINPDALSLFFRYSNIPAPYSIFQHTWKLMPGTILSISPEELQKGSRHPEAETYWSALDIAEAGQGNMVSIGFQEAAEQLESLLGDAIRLRMISDVPIGAFLSGGVDSSAIVALMQAQSTRKVKTFSIGFRETGYDEAGYAKAIAEHLGTDHTELYVSSEDALQVIPDLPAFFDEPFSDSSQIPTYLLSKLTREHVTVCLSGDGGDEVFGGYNRHFLWESIWRNIKWIPAPARVTLARMFQSVPPGMWDAVVYRLISVLPAKFKLDTPGDRIFKLSEAIAAGTPELMYRSFVSHWKHPEDLVRGTREPLTMATDGHRKLPFQDFTHVMMALDLATYLPDDILTKVDRASMSVALETRVPILDHRVVEFSWRLPLEMKVKNRQGKRILREVLYKYVPKSMIERPKTGFAVPLETWLRGPLRDWAESLLDKRKIKEQGLLNPDLIHGRWREHLSGKQNRQHEIWDVLMFQEWKKQYNL